MNSDKCCRGFTQKKRGRKRVYGDLPSDVLAFEGEVPRNVFFRALNNATQGDQQPLRKLWAVAEREGCNVARLIFSEQALAVLLAKHQLHSNPGRYARQMLICLGRLIDANPGSLSMLRLEPVISSRIHCLPWDEVPDKLRNELDAWIRMTPVAVDGKPALAGALSQATIEDYERNLRTILAAVELAGIRLDPTVGIAFLSKPGCVRKWMRIINSRCAKETIAKHLSALLRIARDLPGAADVEDIAYVEARLADAMTTVLELDGDKLSALAAWTEPERHACLLSAPDELMKRAEDKRVQRRSRLLAGAAGFALMLMWEHSAIRERGVAEFDLKRDVRGDPGSRIVLRYNLAIAGRPDGAPPIPEPMSSRAESLLDRLLQMRLQVSEASDLLLPGEDGAPRDVRSAMEAIYTQIQGIVGVRLVASDLRDLNAFIALSCDVDLPEVAAGIGNKHARSVERRFGHVATKPDSQKRRRP